MKELITSGLLFVSSPAQAAENNIVWNDDKHMQCLAMNMYHEARDQGTAGKLAVSAVVLNRVNDSRFPNTICEVVKQGPTRKSWRDPAVSYPIRNKCQFSWYCDGLSDKIPSYDKEVWEVSLYIARGIYTGRYVDNTFGATHYHAYYVSPKWASKFRHTTTIDDHIFYRYD